MLQFGVNKTTGSGLFNGIDIWSAIPADVKAHIARVTADGGTVPNQTSMVSMVKKLIAANLWNNCVFFGLCLGGVKKDGNEYVSKVYDLKANADLLQSTGTAQPKYDNGSLLYDGGDYLLSGNVQSPIQNATTNISVIMWLKGDVINAIQGLITRYNSASANNLVFIMSSGESAGFWQKYRVLITNNGGTVVSKLYRSSIDAFTGNWVQIAFTFSNDSLKLYVDGVEDTSVVKQTNAVIPSLFSSLQPISLGSYSNGINRLANGSQTALHQIYNSTLTAEQILWNYNNIRPEGV